MNKPNVPTLLLALIAALLGWHAIVGVNPPPAAAQDRSDPERQYRSARELSAAIVRLEREDQRLRGEVELLKQRVRVLEAPPPQPIASTSGPPAVTRRILDVRGHELELKPVRVVECLFTDADSDIDLMPGVEISSNGLVSIVDSKAYEVWMRIQVADSDGESIYVFAQKEKYGAVFATLPRETTLDIAGVVVPLTGLPGWFGIVATRIEIRQ